MTTKREPLAKRFGKALKIQIKRKGMTQAAFAEEMGYVNDEFIRRWIYDGIVKAETMDRILDFFDMDFEEFLDLQEFLFLYPYSFVTIYYL